LRTIIDSLPVAVSVRDRQGRYVVVNRMIAERTGRAATDLLGKTLIEVWGEAGAPQAEDDRTILEAGGTQESQVLMDLDPESLHLDIRRSVITLPGGEPGVLTVAEDITERIRGLAAMEVSAAKSRFFASLSHELRAPLNSMLGFAELLSSSGVESLTDRQQRYLANIRAGGDHLLALINDLLDLSRLEAGKLELRLEPVPLAEAAREVVERMVPVAAAKGVDLCASSSRSNSVAWADRRRVEQVLYNLLSNAIKFTPAGGSVTVRTQRLRGRACLWVRDTGVGISPAELERIFEEFTQLESGLAHRQAGSGLGLSVVRGLVGRMDGSIDVRSSPGRGSTFTVLLPPAPRRAQT
jgi:PAS domain S-box-containing protein